MCDSSKAASSFSPLGFSFCSRALGGERLLVDRRRAQGPHPYSYTSSSIGPDPDPQPEPPCCFRPLFDQEGFPDAADTTVRASLTFGASPTLTNDEEGNPGIVMANTTVLTYSEGSEELLSFKWTDPWTDEWSTKFTALEANVPGSTFQGYLTKGTSPNLPSICLVGARNEDGDYLVGAIMAQDENNGFSAVASIEDYIDDDWHKVRVAYDPSGYEEGKAIVSESVSVWVDETALPLAFDSGTGTYGPPEALLSTQPIKLGVYYVYDDKENLPDEFYYVETPLADLRVCNYFLAAPFSLDSFRLGRGFGEIHQGFDLFHPSSSQDDGEPSYEEEEENSSSDL